MINFFRSKFSLKNLTNITTLTKLSLFKFNENNKTFNKLVGLTLINDENIKNYKKIENQEGNFNILNESRFGNNDNERNNYSNNFKENNFISKTIQNTNFFSNEKTKLNFQNNVNEFNKGKIF